MKSPSPEGKPLRREGLWLRQADSENAVYDPTTQSVHLLNDTALAIWDLCDGKTAPGEMVAAICDLSGLPPEVVNEDVQRTLSQFQEAGLVLWVE